MKTLGFLGYFVVQITLLLYYRADPLHQDRHGMTPFDVACSSGCVRVCVDARALI